MHTRDITPPLSLGMHVLQHLRYLIVSGEISPGTHLNEGPLSESFDVSRGPIRDALRQLQTEGLVETRRRKVYALGLTEADIEELYSLRTLLEKEALQRSMDRPTTSWTSATAALEQMAAACRKGDVDGFAHADLEFHTAFYASSGHRRLGDVWAQYKPTFAAMLAVTNAQDARDLSPTLRDHEVLLTAARAGNSAQAQQLLIEHMDGSRRRMTTAQLAATSTRPSTSTSRVDTRAAG